VSKVKETDPELIEVFDNFAFDEVLRHGDLDVKTRVMVILASTLGSQVPMLQPDQVKDSLHAYQLAKRGNALRVIAEAVRWGKRGARVNTISPGIIFTPLAKDELTGPRGAGYRRMIERCPVGRGGTPDEVGTVGALLMGPEGAFITGSDFLMDGGVTAAYW
jgi:NAD(P)-dependent dehydrogenase (short-subunit alcohol dehydrogenase family)